MREICNIVFIGEVDSGKSTLIGRLVLDAGSFPEPSLKDIKKISKSFGEKTCLAFIVDQLKEEREEFRTIETTRIILKARSRSFVLIDTPGHIEFLKNMLTGIGDADAAVLVIDAEQGMTNQAALQIYLLKMMGFKNVIVAVNKMDRINDGRKKFQEIQERMLEIFKGPKPHNYPCIPVSAKESINVSRRLPRLSWYKGPSLFEALEKFPSHQENHKRPLRFSIQDSYLVDEEHIAVGKVLCGRMRAGQNAVCLPPGTSITIESIRVLGKRKTNAQAGECVGVTTIPPYRVQRGDIISDRDHLPQIGRLFRCHIFWLSQDPLTVNAEIQVICATQESMCTVEKIERVIDPTSAETISNAFELKENNAGVVILKSSKPLVLESFCTTQELGRLIISDQLQRLGIGTMIDPRID